MIHKLLPLNYREPHIHELTYGQVSEYKHLTNT